MSQGHLRWPRPAVDAPSNPQLQAVASSRCASRSLGDQPMRTLLGERSLAEWLAVAVSLIVIVSILFVVFSG